ncbi:MAG TPA: hypothetical protein VL361_16475 [Candidatus Limnocylindrales bacterium]|jgi:hypothetical protein|nr:hypothetical protein [Candidatus Limnocylindrales bacterium]
MISFIQLPYRKPASTQPPQALKPWVLALILGLILCLQIGLVLWVFLRQLAV